MLETIITALIGGAVTLVGVLISNGRTQAVNQEKLENLTREVRKHNGFAEKIPVMQEQISEMKRRVEHLEEYHAQ